jgi:hypothetical protein
MTKGGKSPMGKSPVPVQWTVIKEQVMNVVQFIRQSKYATYLVPRKGLALYIESREACRHILAYKFGLDKDDAAGLEPCFMD